MLAKILLSALLAGPAAADVIRTITVTPTLTSTVTVHPSSTPKPVFSYSPSGAAAPGINPINGLPAAPPHKPSSAKSHALGTHTTIRPILFTSVKGGLTAIYKSGPASTFAVPPRPTAKPSSSKASGTAPINFSTFTPIKGGGGVTMTNSPGFSKTLPTSKPSSYSALSQAPPQMQPTIKITPVPAPSSAPPAPPAPAPEKPSTTKKENPYPYPTPEAPKPKESTSTKWSYPYPTM